MSLLTAHNNQMGNQSHQVGHHIRTLNVKPQIIKCSTPVEKGPYCYPSRTNLSLPDQITQLKFKSQSDLVSPFPCLLEQLTGGENKSGNHLTNLQIFDVIQDELNVDRCLYLCRDQSSTFTLSLRQFAEWGGKHFLEMLGDNRMGERINDLHCPTLMHQQQYWFLEARGVLDDLGTQVVQLEPVQFSLNQAIDHRRNNHIQWTLVQFYRLFADLLQALLALHCAQLTHNDIRPYSVYFSIPKNRYILGNFSNVLDASEMQQRIEIKNSNHYRDHHRHTSHKQSEGKQSHLIETASKHALRVSEDIYALGMTLLSTFYLCAPVNRKACAPVNRTLCSDYPILQLIMLMIAQHSKRITLYDLRDKFNAIAGSLPTDCASCLQISAACSKSIKTEANEVNEDVRLQKIPNAFRSLKDVQKWRQALFKRYDPWKEHGNPIEQIEFWKQLAHIHNFKGEEGIAVDYIRQAVAAAADLGRRSMEAHDTSNGYFYFLEGESLSRKWNLPLDQDSIFSFLSLSLIQCKIYRQKHPEAQRLTQIQNYLERHRQADAVQLFDSAILLSRVYQFYHNFGPSQDVLQSQLHVIDSLRTDQKIILYVNLAKHFLSLAEEDLFENQQIQSFIKKSEGFILSALNLRGPQETVLNLFVDKIQTRIWLKRGELARCEEQCARIISKIEKMKEEGQIRDEEKVKYLIITGGMYKMRGECLEHKGKVDEALRLYRLALQDFKEAEGSIYSQEYALVLQKMGRIHSKREDDELAAECFEVAKSILARHSSTSNKHFFRIHERMAKINGKENSLQKMLSQTSLRTASRKKLNRI